MLRAKNRIKKEGVVLCGITALIVLFAVGCGKQENKTTSVPSSSPDYFHADADIAMTVRSLADALSVGELLDSTEYDFEGILTDGQGRPLYTDSQGNPGRWQVDVLTDTTAVIRNLSSGDLLPGNLEEYVAGSLGLGRADVVETSEYDDDFETDVTVYDFGSGLVRFETRTMPAANGTDALFVTIAIGKFPTTEAGVVE